MRGRRLGRVGLRSGLIGTSHPDAQASKDGADREDGALIATYHAFGRWRW